MRTNRFIAVSVLTVLMAAACHKRTPVAVQPPAPVPGPTVSPLDQADRSFNAGNYDEAARGYDSYLKQTLSGGERAQALFRLGLTYLLRPGPDWPHATASFKQLMDEFPNSPFKPPANLILTLHSELDRLASGTQQRDQRIRKLTTELDRLKNIDTDRRKRP